VQNADINNNNTIKLELISFEIKKRRKQIFGGNMPNVMRLNQSMNLTRYINLEIEKKESKVFETTYRMFGRYIG
jgi:hypothetical protein